MQGRNQEDSRFRTPGVKVDERGKTDGRSTSQGNTTNRE
jgi:hypothetical protein